jgi:hypothetical protein
MVTSCQGSFQHFNFLKYSCPSGRGQTKLGRKAGFLQKSNSITTTNRKTMNRKKHWKSGTRVVVVSSIDHTNAPSSYYTTRAPLTNGGPPWHSCCHGRTKWCFHILFSFCCWATVSRQSGKHDVESLLGAYCCFQKEDKIQVSGSVNV